MLRLSQILVTVAMILYSGPVVAWLLLRTWRGEAWPSVGLMNAVGIWWFAPLLVLLPVALLVRAREASVIGVLLLLPALFLFGPDFLPNLTPSTSETAPRLRVLSFNALVANSAYDEVAALVQTHQPDVIAIQELSPQMAQELNARIGSGYPYQLLYPWTDPRGIGLWSRYPLTEGPERSLRFWERWVHSAIVDVNGQPIHLFNVHLWPIGTLDQERFAAGLAAQATQVQELHDLVVQSPYPVLVMGDFNASPTNESYVTTDAALEDAWRAAAIGPGFTFPAPGTLSPWSQPFLRIDYLWSRPPLAPVNVQVLTQAGSDHLPLLGDFVVEEVGE